METSSKTGECSSKTWVCSGVGTATRMNVGVITKFHGSVIAAASHSATRDYIEAPAMTIKTECEGEEAAPAQAAVAAGPEGNLADTGMHIRQDYIEVPVAAVKTEYEDEGAVPTGTTGAACPGDDLADTGVHIKQENDFVMDPAEETYYEVSIKQELDIGPTVLQPEIVSSTLSTPNQVGACSNFLLPKSHSHTATLDRQPKQEPDLSCNLTQTIHEIGCNIIETTNDQETPNSGPIVRARVDNTAAERSRLYRQRHREEINRRRRDVRRAASRLEQHYRRKEEEMKVRRREDRQQEDTSQSTRAAAAERNRIYRERNKQKINERRKYSRLLRRNTQLIPSEFDINNIDAIEQFVEATPRKINKF